MSTLHYITKQDPYVATLDAAVIFRQLYELEQLLNKHDSHPGPHTSPAHNAPGPEQKSHGNRGGVGSGSKQTVAILLRTAAARLGIPGVPEYDMLQAMPDSEVWSVAAKRVKGGEQGVADMIAALPPRRSGENISSESIPDSLIREFFGKGGGVARLRNRAVHGKGGGPKKGEYEVRAEFYGSKGRQTARVNANSSGEAQRLVMNDRAKYFTSTGEPSLIEVKEIQAPSTEPASTGNDVRDLTNKLSHLEDRLKAAIKREDALRGFRDRAHANDDSPAHDRAMKLTAQSDAERRDLREKIQEVQNTLQAAKKGGKKKPDIPNYVVRDEPSRAESEFPKAPAEVPPLPPVPAKIRLERNGLKVALGELADNNYRTKVNNEHIQELRQTPKHKLLTRLARQKKNKELGYHNKVADQLEREKLALKAAIAAADNKLSARSSARGADAQSGENKSREDTVAWKKANALIDAVIAKLSPEERDKPVPPSFNTFGEMYDEAGRVQHQFLRLEEQINARLNAILGENKTRLITAPLKKAEKAKSNLIKKMKKWGDPEAPGYRGFNRLGDLVRGTILVPTVEDMPATLEAIKEVIKGTGWKLAGVESKWGEPPPPWADPNSGAGYKDLSMNLISPSGLITELQINTPAMFAAKNEGRDGKPAGHKLYDGIVAIDTIAARRSLTPEEAARKRELELESRGIYHDAWIDSHLTHPTQSTHSTHTSVGTSGPTLPPPSSSRYRIKPRGKNTITNTPGGKVKPNSITNTPMVGTR